MKWSKRRGAEVWSERATSCRIINRKEYTRKSIFSYKYINYSEYRDSSLTINFVQRLCPFTEH